MQERSHEGLRRAMARAGGAALVAAFVFLVACEEQDSGLHQNAERESLVLEWTMPPSGEAVTILLRVATPDEISNETARRGLGKADHTRGLAVLIGPSLCQIWVPPLNTTRAAAVWRHEIRHCMEGPGHVGWR